MPKNPYKLISPQAGRHSEVCETTTSCKTHRRNQSRLERPQPQPPHRRGTFHRRLQPLYTEKRKVSCSGLLPKTKPMQHSCSHYNAISNHSFRKRIELRTQEQPLVAKHIEGTNRIRNDPSRNRRTDEVPFIAGCSHFTRKNTKGFVLWLPPQNITHATFMQPLHCDLQPRLQETHRTTPQEQPLVAKHIEGTNRVRNDLSRNRRTDEVPFIAGCSHLTRKNTRFSAPASSPKHSSCNIHAAITLRSATTASGNA